MGNLSINNKTLDKYFGLLDRLDIPSKKKLIIKLTEFTKESMDFERDVWCLGELKGFWRNHKGKQGIPSG